MQQVNLALDLLKMFFYTPAPMPTGPNAKAIKYSPLTVIPKGKFLIFLRERDLGRTQKEVEDGAGIPNLRLSMYEHSKPISIDHLEKLAGYYGVPARELVGPDSWLNLLSSMQRLFTVFELTPDEVVDVTNA